jgi:hypothetical protein
MMVYDGKTGVQRETLDVYAVSLLRIPWMEGFNTDTLRRATIPNQGCQMVYFQTKNHNLGKIRRALEWKMLLYFMTIWNIFWSFRIIYGRFA